METQVGQESEAAGAKQQQSVPEVKVICPTAEELSQEGRTNIPCPVVGCPRILPQPSALRMHILKVHKIIQNEADKSFITKKKASLRAPMITQFVCPVKDCVYNMGQVDGPRSFSCLKYLKQHFMKMHAEKAHKCGECGSAFGLASDLRRHQQHACGPQSAVTCAVCHNTYSSTDSLNTHQHRKHPALPNAKVRPMCGVQHKADPGSAPVNVEPGPKQASSRRASKCRSNPAACRPAFILPLPNLLVIPVPVVVAPGSCSLPLGPVMGVNHPIIAIADTRPPRLPSARPRKLACRPVSGPCPPAPCASLGNGIDSLHRKDMDTQTDGVGRVPRRQNAGSHDADQVIKSSMSTQTQASKRKRTVAQTQTTGDFILKTAMQSANIRIKKESRASQVSPRAKLRKDGVDTVQSCQTQTSAHGTKLAKRRRRARTTEGVSGRQRRDIAAPVCCNSTVASSQAQTTQGSMVTATAEPMELWPTLAVTNTETQTMAATTEPVELWSTLAVTNTETQTTTQGSMVAATTEPMELWPTLAVTNTETQTMALIDELEASLAESISTQTLQSFLADTQNPVPIPDLSDMRDSSIVLPSTYDSEDTALLRSVGQASLCNLDLTLEDGGPNQDHIASGHFGLNSRSYRQNNMGTDPMFSENLLDIYDSASNSPLTTPFALCPGEVSVGPSVYGQDQSRLDKDTFNAGQLGIDTDLTSSNSASFCYPPSGQHTQHPSTRVACSMTSTASTNMMPLGTESTTNDLARANGTKYMRHSSSQVESTGPTDMGPRDMTSTDMGSTDMTSTDMGSTDMGSTDMTSTGMGSTDMTSTDRGSTDMTSTDRGSTDMTSTGIGSTGMTSNDLTSTDMTSTDMTSTDRGSTDMTSTGIGSTDMSSTDMTFSGIGPTDITSTDMTSTGIGSTDMTSTDLTSTDMGSTDMTSTNMGFTDMTSTDMGSTDMTSTDMGSTDMTSTDMTSTDMTSTDMTSTGMGSTDLASTGMGFTDMTSTGMGSTHVETQTPLMEAVSFPDLLTSAVLMSSGVQTSDYMHMETQTAEADDMFDQFLSNTQTQTNDDFFSELNFSNIETQTSFTVDTGSGLDSTTAQTQTSLHSHAPMQTDSQSTEQHTQTLFPVLDFSAPDLTDSHTQTNLDDLVSFMKNLQ